MNATIAEAKRIAAAQLDASRRSSEIGWEAAAEDPDKKRGAEAAAVECDDFYAEAIEKLDVDDAKGALRDLRRARDLEARWGDDQPARQAIEAVDKWASKTSERPSAAKPSAKPSRESARSADRTRLAAELQEQETKRDARTQEIADLEKTIASSKKQIVEAKKHEKSHASKAKALKAKLRKLL
jgi:hypothetical protein